jgi:hypothetical protein
MLDSNSLFLTGNTDTVYAVTTFDLSDTGPIVMDIPAGCGPGTVDDAYFRFVTDMGAPGPDRGAGGKYLIHSARRPERPPPARRRRRGGRRR